MLDHHLLSFQRSFVTYTRNLRFHSTSRRVYQCCQSRPLRSNFVTRSSSILCRRTNMSEDKSQDPPQTRQSHNAAHADVKDMKDVPETEQWKYRAPYTIHEPSDGFKAIYTGQCHCGQVKFELNRDQPLACKYCHCVDCQVQHGT